MLIRSGAKLPPLPQVDVLCLGIWVRPELACNHGVYFVNNQQHTQLEFVLQKRVVFRFLLGL